MAIKKRDQAADALLKQHPSQRFESPSRGVSAVLHAGGLVSFALSFKFLIDNPNAISEAYGWHFQFLTIIGLWLATITFIVALVADLTLSPQLFVVKNALSVASAPMEVLISILYWSLRFINPSLVRADFLPDLPIHADIGFHAVPAIVLAIDTLFLSPPWAISAVPAMVLSAGIATAYWFWVEHCRERNGFYPYPIFDVETPVRAGIFTASALVMTLSTVLMKALYTRVNGEGSSMRAAMNGSAKKQR